MPAWTKLTRREIADFAMHDNVALMTRFHAMLEDPRNRVKSGKTKGHIKWSVIKRSDKILAEIDRRNA